jgi:hypothetical protein
MRRQAFGLLASLTTGIVLAWTMALGCGGGNQPGSGDESVQEEQADASGKSPTDDPQGMGGMEGERDGDGGRHHHFGDGGHHHFGDGGFWGDGGHRHWDGGHRHHLDDGDGGDDFGDHEHEGFGRTDG